MFDVHCFLQQELPTTTESLLLKKKQKQKQNNKVIVIVIDLTVMEYKVLHAHFKVILRYARC